MGGVLEQIDVVGLDLGSHDVMRMCQCKTRCGCH